MARFVFDFGNARGKWFRPRENAWGDFLHAVTPLSEIEWEGIVGRGKPPEGIIKVNGVPYAVGDAARRHVIKERPKGAARYTPNYYAPGALYAMTEAFRRDSGIALYASHAPQDQRYAQDLVNAIEGQWEVEGQYGLLHFDVHKVVALDEPLCGFAHYAFTKRGDERLDNPLRDKTCLIVDIGGYTADRAAIDPGGEVDLLSIHSSIAGTIAALEQFENDLRHNNRELFKTTGNIDIRRIEAAIVSGEFQFGRHKIDCRREAKAAISGLVNDVVQVIESAGGAANFDNILLDGGGAALIQDVLAASFPAIEFIPVEPDKTLLKYANVFGGAKIAALMTKAGEIA